MRKWYAAVLICSTLIGTLAPAPNAALAAFDTVSDFLQLYSEGDDVICLQMRLRDLGYFGYKVTGIFGQYTAEAVQTFQKVHGLTQDGIIGPETSALLYSNEAKRNPTPKVKAPPATPTPKPTPKPNVGTGAVEMLDWFKSVQYMIPRGATMTVIDYYTGVRFQVRRIGGYNHADIEPLTKADTAKIKQVYGGAWSWNRRPVIVLIGNRRVAGSINGMPHGYEWSTSNGMDGQICLHFLNSMTHLSGKGARCPAHQQAVRIAAGR